MGFVYLWTGGNAKDSNRQMLGCIRRDISELEGNPEVLTLQDINANLEDLDGYTDMIENMLVDACEEPDLVLVNNEKKSEGKITW